MSVRIVTQLRLTISTDLEQKEVVVDEKLTLDDTEQSKAGVSYTTLIGGADYVTIPLPNGITRVGFLHVESDAPITIRLNGTEEVPIAPVITPALVQAYTSPAPTIIPSVQFGSATIRPGVAADGHTTLITTVEAKSLSLTASAKFVVAGE